MISWKFYYFFCITIQKSKITVTNINNRNDMLRFKKMPRFEFQFYDLMDELQKEVDKRILIS